MQWIKYLGLGLNADVELLDAEREEAGHVLTAQEVDAVAPGLGLVEKVEKVENINVNTRAAQRDVGPGLHERRTMRANLPNFSTTCGFY